VLVLILVVSVIVTAIVAYDHGLTEGQVKGAQMVYKTIVFK
jgi:hypothetical protein